MSSWWDFDPDNITITSDEVTDAWKVCVIDGVYFGGNEYNGMMGARISSIFVVLVTSCAVTLFPVLATNSKKFRVPLWVYLFARYFGTGVILATAFIHLIDPAYGSIGGLSCVGRTGHWADYSWCPAIMLATVFVIFLIDVYSSFYVEAKYGIASEGPNVEDIITSQENANAIDIHADCNHGEDREGSTSSAKVAGKDYLNMEEATLSSQTVESEFHSQFAAFLILEFGVIFHSVMIGLNLGTVGDEFKTLYPVIVFHQAFEGLGVGARLSAIPFPKDKRWWPHALCLLYGFTTPICIAIGLGVRTTYDGNSYTANVISGVLDATSAGILTYTAMVELLARDFIFNPNRTKSFAKLNFMIGCVALGGGLMALLGKWA